MSKLKKLAIGIWIGLQIFIIFYLWGIILYTAVTSKPIGEFLRWDWWVFLFMLDLWTAKFFADRRELSKKSE